LTSDQRPFVSARAIADDDHARRLGHAPILSRTFSAAAWVPTVSPWPSMPPTG
jgi:hypothetical protein